MIDFIVVLIVLGVLMLMVCMGAAVTEHLLEKAEREAEEHKGE